MSQDALDRLYFGKDKNCPELFKKRTGGSEIGSLLTKPDITVTLPTIPEPRPALFENHSRHALQRYQGVVVKVPFVENSSSLSDMEATWGRVLDYIEWNFMGSKADVRFYSAPDRVDPERANRLFRQLPVLHQQSGNIDTTNAQLGFGELQLGNKEEIEHPLSAPHFGLLHGTYVPEGAQLHVTHVPGVLIAERLAEDEEILSALMSDEAVIYTDTYQPSSQEVARPLIYWNQHTLQLTYPGQHASAKLKIRANECHPKCQEIGEGLRIIDEVANTPDNQLRITLAPDEAWLWVNRGSLMTTTWSHDGQQSVPVPPTVSISTNYDSKGVMPKGMYRFVGSKDLINFLNQYDGRKY